MSMPAALNADHPREALPQSKRPILALSTAKLSDIGNINRNGSISPVVVRGCMRLADVAVTAAVGIAIAIAYVNESAVAANPRYLLAVLFTSVATLVANHFINLYSLRALSSALLNAPRIVLGWTIAFASLTVGLFLLKMGGELSRVWLATWYVTGAGALMAERFAAAHLVRTWAKSGRLYQRVAIYGAGAVTDDLIAQLEADDDQIVRITGIFDERGDSRVAPTIAGYPRLGGLAELIATSRTSPFDLVIVALPLTAEQRLGKVVKDLSVLPADIKMPARATAIRFSPRTYSHVGSVAMISLYDKPLANWGTVSKWLFDRLIGALALVLLAPVMAAVAVAVRLDSRGPVLFRQKRYGFNNELIEVYKFRSMYTDRCDAAAAKLVTRDDPRVTRVGRIIRKTSLDELPQLLNVLRGDLSLVGPRPHAVQARAGAELYDEVVDGYFARHKVKPGITGWAQINGWRGETDTREKIEKRVEHDLYYIENWSVFLDLYILLKTPLSLLKAENAY